MRRIFTKGIAGMAVMCTVPALTAGMAAAMTLGEAIEYARLHNPAISVAHERYMAAESVEGEIGWLPDPVLALGYKDGGWMADETMQMLMVDQSIPFPTKVSGRKSKAGLMAMAERARYETQMRKTIKNVKAAYIDLLLVDATIGIYEDDLQDALAVMESAREKYETGIAPYHDLSRSRVDALLTENDLETLREDDRVEAAAELRAALGMAEDGALGELSIPEVPIMDVRMESLNVYDASGSPELDEYRREAEAMAEDLSLARQRYIPDFKLRFWTERKESDMGEISTRGFMVFFNVPLWFWNAEAGKDVRAHRYGAAESMLETQKNRVARDLEAAVAAFRATRDRLAVIENAIIPEAELSYASATTAYETDGMDLAGLTVAKEVLRDAKLARVRLWARASKELAEIERLTGLTFY